jgi:adenosine deaminase
LHSDDPAYFGGYLSHCLVQTARALDLSAAEIVEMNKNAIRAAFLDRTTKGTLLAASDATLVGGIGSMTAEGGKGASAPHSSQS